MQAQPNGSYTSNAVKKIACVFLPPNFAKGDSFMAGMPQDMVLWVSNCCVLPFVPVQCELSVHHVHGESCCYTLLLLHTFKKTTEVDGKMKHLI